MVFCYRSRNTINFLSDLPRHYRWKRSEEGQEELVEEICFNDSEWRNVTVTTPHPPWKSHEADSVEVGLLFACKAVMQLITNPFIGPITNRLVRYQFYSVTYLLTTLLVIDNYSSNKVSPSQAVLSQGP